MLDGLVRRLIDPPLDRAGEALARWKVPADLLTLLGFVTGLLAAAAIALEHDRMALVLLVPSRVLDGLDGATARASTRTDRGGFVDIVFDFAFYGAIPLAFAVRDPGTNALAAAVLLFSFYVNGASFLAFAAVAARRGLESDIRGVKSIYFTAGLAEGTETILVIVLMVLLPAWFPILAYGFAGVTLMSAVARVTLAWRVFADRPGDGR
jgi:phosphatidylglycerophosphate synthase